MVQWISAWGYQAMDFSAFPIKSFNKTIAVQFRNNVNGSAIRLMMTNVYGREPLKVARMSVSISDRPEKWEPEHTINAKLNRKESFEVPAGTRVYSDIIRTDVRVGDYVTVFVQLKDQAEVVTGASCFRQDYTRVYCWEGTGDISGFKPEDSTQIYSELLAIENEHECFFGVEQVDVLTDEDVKTIVCFGDSITHRSFWTGPLAERLIEEYPGKVTLLNCGLSGNRIIYDESPLCDFGPWLGKAGRDRFENDVFNRNRVDLVFVLQGINDIFHPLYGHAPKEQTVTAPELIEGLTSMIGCARCHRTKIVGCTITPWKNCFEMFAPVPEKVRTDVNEWIRNSGKFDAVFDYSNMIADPDDPEAMLPLYDSGDNVHPSAAGGRKIAEDIDLGLIAKLLGIEG